VFQGIAQVPRQKQVEFKMAPVNTISIPNVSEAKKGQLIAIRIIEKMRARQPKPKLKEADRPPPLGNVRTPREVWCSAPNGDASLSFGNQE